MEYIGELREELCPGMQTCSMFCFVCVRMPRNPFNAFKANMSDLDLEPLTSPETQKQGLNKMIILNMKMCTFELAFYC